VPQLNLGTFGVLVQSVAELGNDDSNDPMLLVTRPQKAIDFTIGDNTAQSPALTIHLQDFEIDVYAFLFERYTRAFTMSAKLDVGINIEFDQPAGGAWQVKPTLVGLSSSDVAIKILNNQFVAESAAQLEAALPSVFDLLASQLEIPTIDLPTFAGFAIGNPSIAKVTSTVPAASFLALNANLDVVAPVAQIKSVAHAKLRSIDTPPIDSVRKALVNAPGGKLPAVTFDVAAVDQLGRPLEWSWRLGNGLWHPYSEAAALTIIDRAFAWQGEYTIGLMSRVRGEPGTASGESVTAVVIDSVGPHVTKQSGWDGERYVVRGWDVVGKTAIKIAFGSPGDDAPRTEWQAAGSADLSRGAVNALAIDGELTVFLEDERGNRTVANVQPFHGQAGASGCSCDAGTGSASSTLLFLLVALGLRRRRSQA
jgi:MYXO-CTERM domain-containing protein